MEIVGWITIILLCALALAFIVIELGPVIHSEISFWKFRKQKATEAKEDKARFKKGMRDLKYRAKKLEYMKKKGLITEEEAALYDAPAQGVVEDKNEAVEEEPTYWVTMTGEVINPSDIENTQEIDDEAFEEPVNDEIVEEVLELEDQSEEKTIEDASNAVDIKEETPLEVKKVKTKRIKNGK